MLASCSSSNQFASSFSKRKYTTGHFSDPVAKVKAPNVNASVLTVTGNNDLPVNNVQLAKNEKPAPKADFNSPAKSGHVAEKNNSVFALMKTVKQGMYRIAKVPVNSEGNISLKGNSSIQDSPAMGDHGGGGGGSTHRPYLLYCLLCILLMLVFFILAAASVVSGSGGGLVFWAYLAYFAGLAATVFFVLWIIQLAS